MEAIGEFSFQPIRNELAEKIGHGLYMEQDPSKLFEQVIVHPSDCVMSSRFKKYAQKIQDFKVYPDDTWLLGFPRSGTTWSEEMIWLLINNLNFEKAKSIDLTETSRFPYFELEVTLPDAYQTMAQGKTIDSLANAARPRCIKSHLPVQLLPKALWTVKPKIIHVARDPRDVVISYYHYHRSYGFTGTLEDFAQAFLDDRVDFAPFWTYILNFYKLKNQHNILFNTYEDMKRDLNSVIKKTATFLDISINDGEVERLREYLSFKNMKDNLSCNQMDSVQKRKEKLKEDDENLNFIRKGESGGWKEIFTDDLKDKFDKWSKKHLNESGYDKYPWS